jgi:hypothetical protein
MRMYHDVRSYECQNMGLSKWRNNSSLIKDYEFNILTVYVFALLPGMQMISIMFRSWPDTPAILLFCVSCTKLVESWVLSQDVKVLV